MLRIRAITRFPFGRPLYDLDLLAERKVGVVHNPSSNLRLRSGIAPLAEMVASGVSVGLGLDGHGLADDQDFLTEMRLAWALANQPIHDSTYETSPIEARNILDMVTSAGARITFGSEALLGVLRVGACADLMVVEWPAKWKPCYCPNPEQALRFLLRRTKTHHIKDVMIAGRWVLKGGSAVCFDISEVEDRLREQLEQSGVDSDNPTLQAAQRIAPQIRKFYQS